MEWSNLIQRLKGKIEKVWLLSAFILVSALSYEAGSIQEALHEPKPVVIEVPNTIPQPSLPERRTAPSSTTEAVAGTASTTETCAFVGSKNSNKYHAPASRCAKQIKPENRVCFTSVEAALARGYAAGCLE